MSDVRRARNLKRLYWAIATIQLLTFAADLLCYLDGRGTIWLWIAILSLTVSVAWTVGGFMWRNVERAALAAERRSTWERRTQGHAA